MKRLYYIALLLALAACKKESGNTPEPDKPDTKDTTLKTGIYLMNNVVADSMATSGAVAKPLYYSLEEQKAIPAEQAQTANWDICFNGTYNSNICANNGAITASPGYGGPAKGQVSIILNASIDAQYYDTQGQPIKKVPPRALFDQAFNAVSSADAATGKWENDAIVGLDFFQSLTDGWAWYDFYGQLFPAKPASQVAHVAYALPRVLIIKTAKGHYAKLVVYSLYKGAPETPDRSNKPGFITFKYAIQKDGSTNLNIQ